MAYDLGTAHGKIELEYTGRSHAAVNSAERDIAGLSKRSKDTDNELKRFGKTLSGMAGFAAKASKIGAVGLGILQAGAAAGSATIQLLGMADQLATLSSLAAAVPGGIIGIAAAVGVLKASFAGMDKVFQSAFDPTKAKNFDKEIKNLPPHARDFAKALKENAPALLAVQKGIQDAFFSTNLQSLFPAITAGVGQLKGSLNGMAAQFSGIAKEVLTFATNAKSIDFVRASIEKFRGVIQSVQPTLVPILEGLRAVGKVGLPLFDSLGGELANVGTKFADFLNRIASDGTLQAWINTALTTLSSLGALLKNIGSIFLSVMGAANDTGGGLLNTLKEITGQIAAFLKTAEGGDAIRALFTGIMTIARQLSPILTLVVSTVAKGLGPALQTIASTVGPALLSALQAIAPAFGPLVQGAANLIAAIAPLLVPIGNLIGLLATALGPALTTIASEIGPLVSLFGTTLAGAIQKFIPVITEMVTGGLPLAVQFGQQLLQAFLPVAPIFLQLAETLASSLIPMLPKLMEAAQQLLPVMVQLANAVAVALADGLARVIPYIPTMVEAFVNLSIAISQIVGVVMQVTGAMITFGNNVLNTIGSIRAFASGLVSGFLGALTSAYNTVVSVGASIIGWFAALPGRVAGAVGAFVSGFPAMVRAAVLGAAFQFGAGIGQIITFAAALPGRVAAAASGLFSVVTGLVSRTWSAASSAFSSGVSRAAAFAAALPGRVGGAIASLPGLLAGIASRAWAALKAAFSSGVSGAAALARSLPGRIVGAIGNLGGLLVGAGRDVVMGLVHGISGAIGAAVSAAASVGHAVISGIKSTLKISSPSKVMITLGRFISQGLINGLLGTAKQVRAASNKMANYINDAFRAKAITRGSRNSALAVLRSGTSQLLGLVNQSNSVSSRLKVAQANLKTIQDQFTKAQQDAAEKVRSGFNLVTSGATVVNLDALQRKLKKSVDTANDFAANIKKLTARGLDKDLLQQLADAGAQDGDAVAKALANATDEQFNAFNALSSQLRAASVKVGDTVANSLYGAGLKAAQGLVKGLQSQEKAIEKVMINIANKIAGALRKALKIHSPSRLMFNLGQFITRGLADGIKSLNGQVQQAAKGIAQSAVIPALSASQSNGFRPNIAGSVSAASAATGVGGFSLNQTVNALPGMDARQVADYSATKLRLALKTGVSVVSIPRPLPQGA